MMCLPILRFPDPRLRHVAAPVDAFDAALAGLAQDLLDTMRAAPGIGITASHVGIPLRLTVIEIDAASGVGIYVNPEIISSAGDLLPHTEGSVSMPGITETVERPQTITVRYQTLNGDVVQEDATGLLAVCLQHEIDQMNGLFWIQRLSRLKRERAIKRYEKSVRGG